MTEILHHQLAEFLNTSGAPIGSGVYLIHGEPMLIDQCVETLIEVLLKGASRQINCEVLDGEAENIPDALERVNTYGLSTDPRIVWFKDARLFDSGVNQQRLIDQIREAYENEQLERAAMGFANLCTRLGVDAVSAEQAQAPELEPLQNALGEDGIVRLATYCRECGWTAAASDDYLQVLERAIQKGFPERHHLLITSGVKVPKNRKFYKTVQGHGVIIDCNVPQGERRADKAAQETVLRRLLEAALKKSGKRMAPALLTTLVQLTGFDPATFRDNAEKLIDYAGERSEITASDVQVVVRRTKSDPLFELTNAVADRNTIDALFYLHTLLDGGWHALQILAALANQFRKLVIAKEFTVSPSGARSWRSGISFSQFQSVVLPAVQAYDARLIEQVNRWEADATENQISKGGARPKKDGIDLALVTNSGNAYPVYQTLLKAENYRADELVQAMIALNQADMRLKSSGQDATLLMKNLIMMICGKKGG
jgi:DNA polymerase III subunit delta